MIPGIFLLPYFRNLRNFLFFSYFVRIPPISPFHFSGNLICFFPKSDESSAGWRFTRKGETE